MFDVVGVRCVELRSILQTVAGCLLWAWDKREPLLQLKQLFDGAMIMQAAALYCLSKLRLAILCFQMFFLLFLKFQEHWNFHVVTWRTTDQKQKRLREVYVADERFTKSFLFLIVVVPQVTTWRMP